MVITFLHVLRTESDNPQKNHNTELAIELLYSARNLKFVWPLAFSQALVVYFTTRSKVATNIIANASASGSYRTISNWIADNSTMSLKPPVDDHIIFFDNT